MRRSVGTLTSLTLLMLAACGGASVPPQAPESEAQGPTAPKDGGKVADKPVADQKAQHDAFVEGCLSKMQAPDYCECSWGEYRQVFSGGEGSDPAKIEELKGRVKLACASKLTDDNIRPPFTTACESPGAPGELKAYCACGWTTLRKQVSLADFLEPGSERMANARKTVVKSCGKLMPEPRVKADFMKGCTAGDSKKEARCTCLWNVVKANANMAEIGNDMLDMESLKPKMQAGCAKYL